MIEFVRALSYDVDFQRELKAGQKFTVLLEQLVTSDGRVTHPGRLLAGETAPAEATVTVIPLPTAGWRRGLLQPPGESVVRSFLRTPMDAPRSHPASACASIPILGFSALHAGVDFAAHARARRSCAGTGKVVDGRPQWRLRQLREVATHQATSPLPTRTCRGSDGIKPGVAVRQGPGHRLRRLDRMWTGRTCTTSSIAAAGRSIHWHRSSP